MTRMDASARFLMCVPEHFAVTYAINPWMEPDRWSRDHRALGAASRQEWRRLHRALKNLGAKIELVPPVPGLPDLVFTANAAVVIDGTALLARFRHPERRAEEPHFRSVFEAMASRGLIDAVAELPADLVLEGAGDCVFDATRNLFWLGFGPRSDLEACEAVEATFGLDTVALELADARFYHMDTALCPLPGGEVVYLPGAFTAAGRAAIRDRVAPAQRIEITIADAAQLAANAVAIADTLVMSGCSDRLRDTLRERGYRVVTTPLRAFLRSGGAAFCLTLRLDRRSSAALDQVRDRAVA